MEIRVVATSSRIWNPENQDHVSAIRNGLVALRLVVTGQFDILSARQIMIVHGAARGGDRIIDAQALALGMLTEAHAISGTTWDAIGPAAGPKRNRAMLDDPRGCDFLIGFRLGGMLSRGTTDCIFAAQERRIPTIVFDYWR